MCHSTTDEARKKYAQLATENTFMSRCVDFADRKIGEPINARKQPVSQSDRVEALNLVDVKPENLQGRQQSPNPSYVPVKQQPPVSTMGPPSTTAQDDDMGSLDEKELHSFQEDNKHKEQFEKQLLSFAREVKKLTKFTVYGLSLKSEFSIVVRVAMEPSMFSSNEMQEREIPIIIRSVNDGNHI